jgi:hypothetical protein
LNDNRLIITYLFDNYVGSKPVSIRFSEVEYQEVLKEANRKKLTVSAYIRSCVLMRVAGDLIEKQVAEEEYVRRNITMKTLDERGTF